MTDGRRRYRWGIAMVFFLRSTGTASAHPDVGSVGTPVSFPVILWVPVLTGLLGGILALRHRIGSSDTRRHRLDGLLGVLLIGLGGSFAITALHRSPLIGIAAASVGALVIRSIVGHREGQSCRSGRHVDLTLGGVCAHRVVEGIALGTLYLVGASVGVIGVAVIAGHTALETAAVGGMYSHRPGQATLAVVLVQVGYVVGAIIGIVGSVSVPPFVHVVVLGVLAGTLVIIGLAELGHTGIRINPIGIQK